MTYNITLKDTELNLVINALANLPYRDSALVIGSITSQVQVQSQPKSTQEVTTD